MNSGQLMMNLTTTSSPRPLVEFVDFHEAQCPKDALTDLFGWLAQGLLAVVAFSSLVAKRYCEPIFRRRPWEIWWYDSSKQIIGSILIHMANLYIAPMFKGDPCTWYIINFLLDSTIGLLVIYIGIRLCIFLAKVKGWSSINFGEYNAPKSWLHQTGVYVLLMTIVKLLTTLIIQLDFWNDVKNMILSPFKEPHVEVIFVMLIIPFFVNCMLFWVTDNFLMRNKKSYMGHHQLRAPSSTRPRQRRGKSILEKVRVKYKTKVTRPIMKRSESDSDLMLSSDEDPIIQIHDTTNVTNRSSSIQS